MVDNARKVGESGTRGDTPIYTEVGLENLEGKRP
jgi:hypothetical protein